MYFKCKVKDKANNKTFTKTMSAETIKAMESNPWYSIIEMKLVKK